VELFSPDFLSALIAIVIIDLVLAGDNAIVIALAARSLPRHLQKRAILWGTFGAIAVRTSLTLVVVWLLGIPGLLFVGGALLIWIAYKLLLPEDSQASSEKNGAAMNFWGAIRTVVIADTIMGLDNVLAVAGAAHGSFLLVVVGLLISVPIVIWGSTLILKFVERFPAFVYLGAGVLAWTAVKMMMAEPLIAPYLADQKITVAVLYVTVVMPYSRYFVSMRCRSIATFEARHSSPARSWKLISPHDAKSGSTSQGSMPRISANLRDTS